MTTFTGPGGPSGVLEVADAVLIPAEAFPRCGPLLRELNERGTPWALYPAREDGAPAQGHGARADELIGCARRLGVEPSRCAVLGAGGRATWLVAPYGARPRVPRVPRVSCVPGVSCVPRVSCVHRAVESMMERFCARALAYLAPAMGVDVL